MRLCRGCGSPLEKRSQKIYCSNACQGSARRKASTKRWLESGEAYITSLPSHYIRLYLIEAQSGCCAICGAASVWQALPLTLIMDHIDGNATNNRRKTCAWSARTATPNCRHTKAATVATVVTIAASATRTDSRSSVYVSSAMFS